MHTAILTLALLAPTQPAPPAPATPDVKDTVRTGLKWLAEKQQADGTWSGENGGYRTLFTATSGLALLMEGSTLKSGAYATQLRKAVEWLEKNTAESGKIASTDDLELNQFVASHSTALFFLVCVHDVDDDPARGKRLAKVIDKGIAFLIDCRTSQGGWGYVAARDGSDYDDTQTTAVVLQALFAARKAGFEVPKEVTDKATRYLTRATTRDGGLIYSNFGGAMPTANQGLPHLSASAAAGLLMHDGTRPAELPRWVRNCSASSLQQMPGLHNLGMYGMFQQYQTARACYALGETGHAKLEPEAREKDLVKWSAYRAHLHKALRATQGKNGSWPDQYQGPAYTTALALIILQLENDYLPAFSR